MKITLYILIIITITILGFYFIDSFLNNSIPENKVENLIIDQEPKTILCNKNHPDLQKNDIWYFAYGSNLYKPRLETRIGKWQKEKAVVLNNYVRVYASRFEGSATYANIIEDKNSQVTGAIYLISQVQANKLDKFEKVPINYVRIYVPFKDLDTCAYAYQFSGPGIPGEPTDEYKKYISDGLKNFGFK